MRSSFNPATLKKVQFLVGTEKTIMEVDDSPSLPPFDDNIVAFLNDLSRRLMSDSRSKQYSDIVTFAFWIRKSSINSLKERFRMPDALLRVGKGVVFHIAPSNVPVNFAYSFVAGLLCGNKNIVRIPSKEFEQIDIIIDAVNEVLCDHKPLRSYLFLVRYDHDKDVNDLFSGMADYRIVWGGDSTIAELRQSPLPPRSGEVTFADRYSLAVIDADTYLNVEDKEKVANDFYNDTYYSDQNACTSPRIVVWSGDKIEEARQIFWDKLYMIVKQKYQILPVQAVNKLTTTYRSAVLFPSSQLERHEDNLLIRLLVSEAKASLMDIKDNSGFFFEYICSDIMDIRELCNDKRCQTIGYIGDKNIFKPLLESGVKGIDRIVPLGHTMDFDLIWDGYNLPEILTRSIMVI